MLSSPSGRFRSSASHSMARSVRSTLSCPCKRCVRPVTVAPVRGHQRQDIQLCRGVGHDVEKIDGFQMGNQDGATSRPVQRSRAGDAVHVHRQEPVPLPLRAVWEAEFPRRSRKASRHGCGQCYGTPNWIKLFSGISMYSLNIGRGDSSRTGKSTPSPSSGSPAFLQASSPPANRLISV